MFTAWAGADRAWEYIFEEYQNVRYELYGPEGWDEDFIQVMQEEGMWESELAKWEPLPPCEKKDLEIKEETLLWAMEQCQKSSNFYRKKYNAPLI